MISEWYLTGHEWDWNEIQQKFYPRDTIHFHGQDQGCFTVAVGGGAEGHGCYGVLFSERNRAHDGSPISLSVQSLRSAQGSSTADTVQGVQ